MQTKWTREDMIEATLEYFGRPEYRESDCDVVRDEDDLGPFLYVVHLPTGRTSLEAADGGKWNPDGTAR